MGDGLDPSLTEGDCGLKSVQSDNGTILVPHLLDDHAHLVLAAFVTMLGHFDSF